MSHVHSTVRSSFRVYTLIVLLLPQYPESPHPFTYYFIPSIQLCHMETHLLEVVGWFGKIKLITIHFGLSYHILVERGPPIVSYIYRANLYLW